MSGDPARPAHPAGLGHQPPLRFVPLTRADASGRRNSRQLRPLEAQPARTSPTNQLTPLRHDCEPEWRGGVLTLIGGDLSARVVGVVLCPVVAPMLAWVVAAVVITGGFCCRGGALSRGWWCARRVCAGGRGVVVVVGDGGRHRWRRPHGGGGLVRTGGRPLPSAAAVRFTCGWFTGTRVAFRGIGVQRAASHCAVGPPGLPARARRPLLLALPAGGSGSPRRQ